MTGAAIGGGAVARRAAAAPSACHKHEAPFAALSGYASAEALWRLARIEALGEGEARGPAEDAAGAVVTPHACEVRAILKARADAAETRNAGASGRDASSRRRVGTRNAEARERAADRRADAAQRELLEKFRERERDDEKKGTPGAETTVRAPSSGAEEEEDDEKQKARAAASESEYGDDNFEEEERAF